MKQQPGKKVTPRFWWDFEWIDGKIANVKVESDNDLYPVIKRYRFFGDNANRQIYMAIKLIGDLEAGRADPKQVAGEDA